MSINGTLYYMVSTGSTRRLKDRLGSASVVTDASGNIVGEQRYYLSPRRHLRCASTFGETRLATGTMYTDKLFTGQRQIAGLGIYHYQSRFYSPKLGRFLSADSLVPNPFNAQDYNRYSYVRNNPLRYIDPSGHMCSDPEDPTPTCDNSFREVTFVGGKPVRGTGLDAGKPKVVKKKGSGKDLDSIVTDPKNDGGVPNLPGGDPNVGNGGLICPIDHPNCGLGAESCGQGSMVDCPASELQNITLPESVTVHPIGFSPILDVPIYDYDTDLLIGYRHVRYGVYDFHLSAAGYFIPSDPLTWTQFLRDQTRPILKGFVANAESVGIKLSCPPPCGLILTIAATIDSVNSAIILDAHPYTVDLYFTEPPYMIEFPSVP